MVVHRALSKLDKSFGNPSDMTLFCYPNFSTSRMLSTVFDWANDGPSVEREILTIRVHLLWLFHLSFKEICSSVITNHYDLKRCYISVLTNHHVFISVSRAWSNESFQEHENSTKISLLQVFHVSVP